MNYQNLFVNTVLLIVFLSSLPVQAANLQQQQRNFLKRSSSSGLSQQQRRFLNAPKKRRRIVRKKKRPRKRVYKRIRKQRPIISRRKIRKRRKRYIPKPSHRPVRRSYRKLPRKTRIRKRPIYRAKRRVVTKIKQNPRQRFIPKVKALVPEQAPGFVPKPLKVTVNNGLKHIKSKMQWPLIEGASISRIKRVFGWHPSGDNTFFNAGVDIAAPYDLSVLSAFPGQVLTVVQTEKNGLSVFILHGGGESATRYSNLSRVFVKPGLQVNERQIIGEVGSAGKLDEPHINFEYLKQGPTGLQPVDPNPELSISLVRYTQELHLARAKLKEK